VVIPKVEAIIPALESAHVVAYVKKDVDSVARMDGYG